MNSVVINAPLWNFLLKGRTECFFMAGVLCIILYCSFIGNLAQVGRVRLNPKCDQLTPSGLQPWVSVYLRHILFLLFPSILSVLWAVCCGAVTSLSPRCHPASAGFRLAWPLPKPHSATSAIHKRQPLSLSYSLAHTISDTLSLSHPLTFSYNFQILFILFMHSCDCFLPPFLLLFMLNINWLFPYLSLPSLPLFLSFRFFIHIQRKNLSPIISFSGSQLSVVAVN